METMTLSFGVRPIASDRALAAACAVRAHCYGHHVPALRDAYSEPDLLDESGTCTNFLAFDKTSGDPVGTVRIQLNTFGVPLLLESSFEMPEWMQPRTRAELTRLSVLPGADPLVRLMLWKAGLYYCLANQIQCMVIGARRSALIRQYQGLGFEELTSAPVPFAHAAGLPHSVLWLDVFAVERRWHQTNHPLYRFMFRTHHPDLDLFGQRWRPTPLAQRERSEAAAGASSSAVSSQRTSIA